MTTPEADHAGAPTTHTARWVAVGILVIAAGLIAVLATRPPAVTAEAQNPLVNHPAPTVEGVTLDGTHFQLPRAPGHYVVINFFASWCVPCEEEGPQLIAFQFEHHRTGNASMLSVVFNDTDSAARSYQARIGVTWPTLADSTGSLALAFGARENPTSFVIAPNGRVLTAILGGVTTSGLDRIIAKAEASGYGV
ncbi:MAG TPA: TlpA disulfide reductase family protein [Acidimicrobiales bacterium]|nr:TlpA disulfide reductase family protein [Acidimicrobiales bacterium]